MHKRGLRRHAVCVCVCVCVSDTFVDCVKTNNDIFEICSPSGSHTILIFPHQTGWRYSVVNPLTGASNAGGVGKTRFWTNIWLRCIQVYSVVNRTSGEVSKTKPRRTAVSVEHTAASVVRCSHKTTTKCLRRARRYTPERRSPPSPPDTTPLVITPFSAAVGHRMTEPGGYFC